MPAVIVCLDGRWLVSGSSLFTATFTIWEFGATHGDLRLTSITKMLITKFESVSNNFFELLCTTYTFTIARGFFAGLGQDLLGTEKFPSTCG